MFTGIIDQQGIVLEVQTSQGGKRLIIDSNFDNLQIGESISVNGVCLTLLEDEANRLVFDISPETLLLTNLNTIALGEMVNLERAMQAWARFGGHYVSGHVDKTASIHSMTPAGDFMEMIIAGFKREDLRFLLPKGSITVEGVSLTINNVFEESISVMLVPHTLAKTTLSIKNPGQLLNIEFDYLTRIVAHQLRMHQFEVQP